MRAAWIAVIVALACGCDEEGAAAGGGDAAASGDISVAGPVEACDGLDNDGDGLFDEDRCPEGYVCAQTSCTCAQGYSRCGAGCATDARPHTSCGGGCVWTDAAPPSNCDTCAVACVAPLHCVDGRCVCPLDQTSCGGRCTTLASDPQNCGACGNVCADGQVCVAGACRCPAGQRACGERCVDPLIDPQNCGACGVACAAGVTCSWGSCDCPSGTRPCGGACVSLATDAQNCGYCGRVCPAELVCQDSRCVCPEGGSYCDGVCVASDRDPQNCGGCGVVCPAGSRCEASRCVCDTPLARCGGACVDVQTTRAHCGACFNACPAVARCAEGRCVCPGAHGASCAGGCTDLWSDRNNCGACGVACVDATVCAEGVCVGRPVTPSAGQRLGTRRPTFRWASGEATADVCADRACTRVIESLDGDAVRGVTVTHRLEPGVYFWRLRLRGSASAVGASAIPFRVDARDTEAPGLLPGTVDLDGDGLADVVALSSTAVLTFPGRPAGLSTTPGRVDPLPTTSLPTMTIMTSTGDANADGSTDLALYGLTTSRQWHLLMMFGAPIAPPSFMRFEPTFAVTLPTRDVDRNGLSDWLQLRDGGMAQLRGDARGWPIGSDAISTAGTTRDGVLADPATAAALGDVDGDGFVDVALGAPAASPPRVYVMLGSSVGLDRTWTAPPAPRTAGFGAWVASAGDVNGDGYADLLAGLGDAGAAVYLGGHDGLTFHRALIDPTGDAMLVVSAGDVDGDGFGDLVALQRAREALLYRGGADGLAATPVRLTDARWRDVEALHSPGDVDGDGFDDVVAGAAWESTVYIFHGAATGPLARVETLRGVPGSNFGRSVQ